MEGIKKSKAYSDVVILILTSFLIVEVFSFFDTFETLIEFLEKYEYMELDEIFLMLMVSPIGLSWIAYRRFQDAQLERQQRRKQEKEYLNSLKYDSETGLLNRAYFERLIENTLDINSDEKMMLVCIEIHDFAKLSNSLDSKSLQKLIINLSRKLTTVFGPETVLARVSSDSLSLFNKKEKNYDFHKVKHLVLSQIFEIEDDMDIELSLGATFCNLQQPKPTASQLLWQAKSAARTCRLTDYEKICFHDEQAEKKKIEDLKMRSELFSAITNNQLELYFQPQVNMQSNRVIGAEGLIRWNHPTKGFLTPDKFIHLLDNSSLSIAVGEWVMESALMKLNSLISSHPELSVSINISPSHIQQRHFFVKLYRLFQHYPNVKPSNLKIEIVESEQIDNFDRVVASIRDCKELGVRFSLDDFGNGFSALNQLRQLPVSQIKIDRSFVNDFLLNDSGYKMVATMAKLADWFNIEIVAEGVETEEQKVELIQLGYSIVQGYFFSKPLPNEAFNEWIVHHKTKSKYVETRDYS